MVHSNPGSATAPARDHTERASSIWKDRRLGIALAIGIAALAGVLISEMLPRGPTTQAQALLVLLSGVIVGVLAGLAMRSRWAILLAPLIHILALELARPHLLGPTVGAIRMDTVWPLASAICEASVRFQIRS